MNSYRAHNSDTSEIGGLYTAELASQALDLLAAEHKSTASKMILRGWSMMLCYVCHECQGDGGHNYNDGTYKACVHCYATGLCPCDKCYDSAKVKRYETRNGS